MKLREFFTLLLVLGLVACMGEYVLSQAKTDAKKGLEKGKSQYDQVRVQVVTLPNGDRVFRVLKAVKAGPAQDYKISDRNKREVPLCYRKEPGILVTKIVPIAVTAALPELKLPKNWATAVGESVTAVVEFTANRTKDKSVEAAWESTISRVPGQTVATCAYVESDLRYVSDVFFPEDDRHLHFSRVSVFAQEDGGDWIECEEEKVCPVGEASWRLLPNKPIVDKERALLSEKTDPRRRSAILGYSAMLKLGGSVFANWSQDKTRGGLMITEYSIDKGYILSFEHDMNVD